MREIRLRLRNNLPAAMLLLRHAAIGEMPVMQTKTRAILLKAIAVAALLSSATVLPAAAANTYTVELLVSNQAGAPHRDVRMQNPWGIAFLPGDLFWLADNNSGFSTLYDGNGVVDTFAVKIPLPPPPLRPDVNPKASAPVGIVSNTANDFFVDGDPFWPARFIFNGEEGTISAWFATEGTGATIVVNNSLNGANCKPKPTVNCQGAVYKGLALGNNKTRGPLLFATNFRTGKVEVYNRAFKPISLGAAAFVDNKIPAGYSPYNITNLGGDLYVTYAKQNVSKHDSVSCAGCGFVDIFDTNGVLVRRLLPAGGNAHLNAPWGIALAPQSFWPGGAVLVGNFGDGRINVYDHAGHFLGALQNAATKLPVTIPNLWAILFTGRHGPPNASPAALYFTAGPNNQTNGRFGSITLAK
jgi:uncharacterized protein (TIGR03118 family)